jgi:hypothetical protein
MQSPESPHLKVSCDYERGIVTKEALTTHGTMSLALESMTMRQLEKSPHVPHIIDFKVHGGEAWLQTELIEGQTLQEVFDRSGAMEAEVAVPFLTALAEAEMDIMERGGLCRGIGPADITIRPDGDAVITSHSYTAFRMGDEEWWGLRKMLAPPELMAPEEIPAVGRSTDIGTRALATYRSAVIAYTALTGAGPFTPCLSMKEALQERRQRQPDMTSLTNDMLRGVIRRGMNLDPERRQRDPRYFIDQLGRVALISLR